MIYIREVIFSDWKYNSEIKYPIIMSQKSLRTPKNGMSTWGGNERIKDDLLCTLVLTKPDLDKEVQYIIFCDDDFEKYGFHVNNKRSEATSFVDFCGNHYDVSNLETSQINNLLEMHLDKINNIDYKKNTISQSMYMKKIFKVINSEDYDVAFNNLTQSQKNSISKFLLANLSTGSKKLEYSKLSEEYKNELLLYIKRKFEANYRILNVVPEIKKDYVLKYLSDTNNYIVSKKDNYEEMYKVLNSI